MGRLSQSSLQPLLHALLEETLIAQRVAFQKEICRHFDRLDALFAKRHFVPVPGRWAKKLAKTVVSCVQTRREDFEV